LRLIWFKKLALCSLRRALLCAFTTVTALTAVTAIAVARAALAAFTFTFAALTVRAITLRILRSISDTGIHRRGCASDCRSAHCDRSSGIQAFRVVWALFALGALSAFTTATAASFTAFATASFTRFPWRANFGLHLILAIDRRRICANCSAFDSILTRRTICTITTALAAPTTTTLTTAFIAAPFAWLTAFGSWAITSLSTAVTISFATTTATAITASAISATSFTALTAFFAFHAGRTVTRGFGGGGGGCRRCIAAAKQAFEPSEEAFFSGFF
jgi:hypothetical protein